MNIFVHFSPMVLRFAQNWSATPEAATKSIARSNSEFAFQYHHFRPLQLKKTNSFVWSFVLFEQVS
jgi:hypothetical protein